MAADSEEPLTKSLSGSPLESYQAPYVLKNGASKILFPSDDCFLPWVNETLLASVTLSKLLQELVI